MEDNVFKQVGRNIQKALNEKRLTQQFLADELNISKQVMSKIIGGKKAINVAEITKIAQVLNISTDELLATTTVESPSHSFSFMGSIKNEKTKEKIMLLKDVINEILLLEDYANEH